MTTPNAPDVRQLRLEDLPEVTFPGGKDQTFRVFFDPKVYDQVWKHSTDDVSVEICGVLVGKWARDANGPFVLITESIRGDAATNKFAEVTFTHETWAKINHEMDTRFTQLAIVGWYHSHPNFGIFLSDRDRFIQDHFFSGPGQLAYVVDPVRKAEGVFVWHEGKPVLTPHYWIGNRLQGGAPAGNGEAPAATRGTGQAVETPPSPAGESRGGGGGGWFPLLTQAALLTTVFLLGFLLAGKMDTAERARIEHGAMVRGWMARKDPNLSEELDQVGHDVAAAALVSQALAKEHLKLLSEPKEAQDKWNEVFTRLGKALQGTLQIQAVYALTPEQRRALQKTLEALKPKEEEKNAQPKEEKAPAENKEQPKTDEKDKPKDDKPSEKNP